MNDLPPRKAAGFARRSLIFGLAGCWILFLAGLAFMTADPVTLNRDQLLLAQATGAVVVAEIVDPRSGKVQVREVLSIAAGLPVDVAEGTELTIPGLAGMELRTGKKFVLPLILPAGSENLVPAPTRQGPGQAYPAQPDVVQDVKQLLAGR